MPKIESVLWVEDDARTEYHDFLGPIYVAGYSLTLATNVTDAVGHINRRRFDAIIIDIRLPPGSDPIWVSMYSSSDSNPKAARLGFELIRSFFGPDGHLRQVCPRWLTPKHCGVFSVAVDEQLRSELAALGVDHCLGKSVGGSRRQVVALIRAIIASRSSSSNA